jgi:energy-coupling factor transporter transmembrane protein EcfT
MLKILVILIIGFFLFRFFGKFIMKFLKWILILVGILVLISFLFSQEKLNDYKDPYSDFWEKSEFTYEQAEWKEKTNPDEVAHAMNYAVQHPYEDTISVEELKQSYKELTSMKEFQELKKDIIGKVDTSFVFIGEGAAYVLYYSTKYGKKYFTITKDAMINKTKELKEKE